MSTHTELSGLIALFLVYVGPAICQCAPYMKIGLTNIWSNFKVLSSDFVVAEGKFYLAQKTKEEHYAHAFVVIMYRIRSQKYI